MPSTFTESLRLEEQGVGENNNTWGERLNRVIEFADKAIAGAVEISVSSGTTTLSTANNQEDEARYRILRLTGSLSGAVTVQVPEVSKDYIVIDDTTRNGETVTFRLGSGGSTVSLPTLPTALLATDGSSWVRPGYYPASDSEVNNGTDTHKWVTPAGLKQNLDTRLGTSGNLGTAATRDVGTGSSNLVETSRLDTRLSTSGNLGTAATRDVGTASSSLVETSQLNTRLGTSGNLGSMATRDVTVSTATPSSADMSDGELWFQYV